jgi:hypothetical protein
MRRVVIALVSAALLGGVALTTVASAHSGGQDLHYIAEVTSFKHSDLGPGPGSRLVVVNFDLFEDNHEGGAETQQYTPQDHTGEEKAGHGVATCVTADMAEGTLCTGTIMVADGQISSQGIIHMHSHEAAGHDGGEHSVKLPVTGGSGRFIGAAGEVEISHAEGGESGEGGGTSEMHAMGMTPDDHGGDHGSGHHTLHLTFHLQ